MTVAKDNTCRGKNSVWNNLLQRRATVLHNATAISYFTNVRVMFT